MDDHERLLHRVSEEQGDILGTIQLIEGDDALHDRLFEHLVDLRDDGSFKLNMKYFAFDYGLTMTNKRFEALFGQPRREGESEIQRWTQVDPRSRAL